MEKNKKAPRNLLIDTDKIRELYRKKKMNQKEFSERVGISQTHFSQIESGKKTPSLATAQNIAMALEVSLDSLFLNPPQPPTQDPTEEQGAGAEAPAA